MNSVDRVEVNSINTPHLCKLVIYSVNSFPVTGIYVRKKELNCHKTVKFISRQIV